ncbi:hypothetical protein BGW36DRAFT_27462 [Talaromyces proteolyticus]|uniref:Zn(2)-C6 fungal-type domain-containing protein n=1 Tax=Talaromyces proteolyticus TaxID=1131652 RepID=A0AAD4KNY8_9EURO|nr:uncharacterized protein BGW36DRAFT_27462 [Talaromyces proteolyticus]KAH8692781.1 hypothetical protein BGW36DRAFT_27462 [Talaromyces proteolyticus]
MDPRRTCSQCGRTFSRREHCARHMLIHGNTRPYTCEFCDYSFQRHDAMLRHKEKFCTNRPGAQARSTAARQPSEKPKSRVRVACQQCHSKKLKCNGADPCQNCARKQVDCVYFREQNDMHVMTLSSRPGREAANQSESSSFLQQPNLFDGLNEQYNLHDSTELETPFMEFDSNLMLFDTDSFLWTNPYFFIDPMDSDVVGAGGEHRNDVITNPNNIMASFENFMRFIDPSEVLKLDAQVNRYLQTPHISRPYDLNLLNILLTIFMKHISPMFRSFDGFHIDSNTLPEQIIGASAIGALFTSVPGNMKVARMLYADCSRMVNSYVSRSLG